VRLTGLLAFTAFLLLGLAWALGSPVYSAPDEGQHVTRAAAAVRGELIGGYVVTSTGYHRPTVHAPYGVIPVHLAPCYRFQPTYTADCQRTHRPSARMVATESDAARYYPPYYLVDGLPSLVHPSPTSIYAMRALCVLMCAALFGLAVASCVLFDRPMFTLGLFIATTPMVVYMASTVNPSAVEISGGLLAWTAGLALTRPGPRTDDDTGRLVRRTALGGAAMLLTRPTAPLWLLLICLLLMWVAGASRLRALSRRTDVRVAAAVLVTLAVANVAWTVFAGAIADSIPNPPHAGFVHGLTESLSRWTWRNEQLVGVFGWLDTFPPLMTFLIWWVVLSVLAVATVRRVRSRWRAVFLVTLGITWLLPVLIEAHEAYNYGWPWQGRYTLPFAVGVPLVATAGLSEVVSLRRQRRLLLPVTAVLVIGQLGALLYNQLRYQHGLHQGFDVLTGRWLPPVGPWAVLVLAVLGCAGLVATAATVHRSSVPLALME